jgi:hypothetical protein
MVSAFVSVVGYVMLTPLQKVFIESKKYAWYVVVVVVVFVSGAVPLISLIAKHASRATGPPHVNTLTAPYSKSRKKVVPSPNANIVENSGKQNKFM